MIVKYEEWATGFNFIGTMQAGMYQLDNQAEHGDIVIHISPWAPHKGAKSSAMTDIVISPEGDVSWVGWTTDCGYVSDHCPWWRVWSKDLGRDPSAKQKEFLRLLTAGKITFGDMALPEFDEDQLMELDI